MKISFFTAMMDILNFACDVISVPLPENKEKSNKIFGFYDNFTPKIQILRKFHGKQRLLCFQISIDYTGSSLYFLGQK